MHRSESEPRDFVACQDLSSFFSFSLAELRRQLLVSVQLLFSFEFIPKLVIPIKMSLKRRSRVANLPSSASATEKV